MKFTKSINDSFLRPVIDVEESIDSKNSMKPEKILSCNFGLRWDFLRISFFWEHKD
jgi:hypothetical protein